MALHLIVNLQECKSGQIFPVQKSEWDTQELVKVLDWSGLAATRLRNPTQVHLVRLLIEHVNRQDPLVYALQINRNQVVLNGQDVQLNLSTDKVTTGLRTKTVQVKSCEQAWQKFFHYYLRHPVPKLNKTQPTKRKLIRRRDPKSAPTTVTWEQQLQEMDAKLQVLQRENTEYRSALKTCQGKNANLARDLEAYQARYSDS